MKKNKVLYYISIAFSIVFFFSGTIFFNDLLIFSLNTSGIYYTNISHVFFFRLINGFLISLIPLVFFVFLVVINKVGFIKIFIFYFLFSFLLFLSFVIKRYSTLHIDLISIENYPFFMIFIYLICSFISCIGVFFMKRKGI